LLELVVSSNLKFARIEKICSKHKKEKTEKGKIENLKKPKKESKFALSRFCCWAENRFLPRSTHSVVKINNVSSIFSGLMRDSP
jgi:hypothetical protein